MARSNIRRPMHPPGTDIPNDIAASTLNQRSRFSAARLALETAVAGRAFPGAAYGVMVKGRILALDSVGRFTYDATSPAVQPTTVYDLASVTKVVATTSAAMLLYGNGRLDLEQPVGDILPGFFIGASSPRERRRVTLRTLLAHSSGLPAYARLFETNRSPAALLQACLTMPLEAPPGTRAEYSDIGFILLGKAIEVLTGQSLDNLCLQELFKPLAMASTRYNPPQAWRTSIPPTVDDREFRSRIVQGEVHDENCFVLGGVSGHAGVFSNVLDLLRFASSLLEQPPPIAGGRLFENPTLQLFASRQEPQPASSRALGWDTPSGISSSGHRFSRHSIGHLGYTGTSLWIDLERQIAIVLLTNRIWPDCSSQAIRTVRPLFHDAVFHGIASSHGA